MKLHKFIRDMKEHPLLLIMISALLVRVLAVFVVGERELHHEFLAYIPNLLSGRGFAYYSVDRMNQVSVEFVQNPLIVIPSAYRLPIYPLFLALIMAITGINSAGVIIIEIFQSILGMMNCWLIFQIVIYKLGKTQAMLAALLMAFIPILIIINTTISEISFTLTGILLVYWALIRLESQYSTKWVIILAVNMGFFLLVRPEGVAYLIFIICWLVINFSKKRIQSTLLLLLISLAIFTPWVFRNTVHFGKPLIATSPGYNLWTGQNKESLGVDPGWSDNPPPLPVSVQEIMDSPEKDNLYELKIDNAYLTQAIIDIKEHPLHVIRLAFMKFLFMWTAFFYGVDFHYPGVYSPFFWLVWVTLMPFFVFGVYISFRRCPTKFIIFYVSLLFTTFIQMLGFYLPRFTIPLYPWVILFASQGLFVLYNMVNNKSFDLKKYLS